MSTEGVSVSAEAARLPSNGAGEAPADDRIEEAAVTFPAAPVDSSVGLDSLFRRSLAIADMGAVGLALVLGVVVIGNDRMTLAALLVPPLFVLVAKALGLYDRDQHLLHKTTLDELPALFGVATLGALLLWLSGGLLIVGGLSRPQVLGIWAMLFVALVALRTMARSLARRAAPVERCLFVGDSDSAQEFWEKLATSHSVKAELIGWIPAVASGDGNGHAPELADRIRRMVAAHEVHRVVLGSTPSRSEEFLDSIRSFGRHGVKVSVLPDVARVVTSSVAIDRLNGITLLGMRRAEFTQSSRIVKRSFDLAGSVTAIVLLLPVFLLIAIAIKVDSRGPVLFRHRRAGRHGKTFEMLKFRSMCDGADERQEELRHLNEADGVFKIADDPRVTGVGRLLRRLHLDELPQLVNVVRGEMSLVGPRPLPLDEDRAIAGWRRRRLDLRPGITGPWQILGSSRIPVREMVKLDYQYVADWSLWNDVRVLLLTVGHIARKRGL